MLSRLTKFADATLDHWSPFRLRKRINELHERVDRIFETKEELEDSAHAFVLKENAQLKKEVERLEDTELKLRHEIGWLRSRFGRYATEFQELTQRARFSFDGESRDDELSLRKMLMEFQEREKDNRIQAWSRLPRHPDDIERWVNSPKDGEKQ